MIKSKKVEVVWKSDFEKSDLEKLDDVQNALHELASEKKKLKVKVEELQRKEAEAGKKIERLKMDNLKMQEAMSKVCSEEALEKQYEEEMKKLREKQSGEIEIIENQYRNALKGLDERCGNLEKELRGNSNEVRVVKKI